MLEGPLVVSEALAAGIHLIDVFVSDEEPAVGELSERCAASGASVIEVGDNVLRAAATTTTPQGIVAVAELPSFSLEELGASVDLVLVLAEVRDPGNAGTLVRTAAAAGAGCVVFVRGSADPFSPKTVRASSGAIFKLPVARGVDNVDTLSILRERGFTVVGARGDAPTTIHDLDLTGKTALVVGNEAWGFGDGLEVDRWASIPIEPEVESLNVAAAGAIFLFEAVRQRRLSSAPHG